MNLKDYIFSLAPTERRAFAERCNTSAEHLMNCAYGYKQLSFATCVLVERESDKAVTRQEMRADWRDVWPELDPVTSESAHHAIPE